MTEAATSVLLDVNVLFALSWDAHVHHEAAHSHFAEVDSWATTPLTENGLVRLLLTPAVTGREVTGSEALRQLAALRDVPGWTFLADDASLAAPHIDPRPLMGRRQVTDLHLVNLAARHSAVLATFDTGLAAMLVPADRRHVQAWTA
ncbi:TA system VapC family ribonuclease toxin [Microbacterium gilvum]|uniref:Ribonuclease VapC n=1 Tax=Microbacterium gilvum TaxID=1336204 RepID=A0ABP8ZU12_9MICO